MNENLDLTKILKGCPSGTVFFSPAFGDMRFIELDYSHYDKCPVLMFEMSTGARRRFTKDGKLHSWNRNSKCILFPSEDQRDWSKFERFWDMPKVERFDINNLQPFDKVLVRDDIDSVWLCTIFSQIDNSEYCYYPFVCMGICWKHCIPYNKETKHLVGTSDECPEYYKWWEV